MPTLRIQFPERDTATTLALTGDRITIGRRADNTVQIVDRTISAFHAELILEGDHYRLHDLGSTNGTWVNGEQVTDYHLREACKIGFGPTECEFSPEVAPGAATVKLPTRIEVEAARRQVEELEGKLAIAEGELAKLREVRAAGEDEAGQNLLKAELERLVHERSQTQQLAQKRQREFDALKTELARMNRDRQNLQDALNKANAEIDHLKSAVPQEKPETPAVVAKPTPPEEPAVAEREAEPTPTRLTSLPKPSSVAAEGAKPIPVATPLKPAAQAVPASTPRPVARPIGVPAAAAPRPVAAAAGVQAKPIAGPSGTQRLGRPQGQASAGKAVAKPLPSKLSASSLPRLGSLPKPTSVSGSEEQSSS